MNAISIDDVKKLARLSALRLDDHELLAMQTDLTQILSYVAQLEAVDTENVQPTYSVHKLSTVVREDVITDYGVAKERLLYNAPKQHSGSIVVPRVIE